MSSAGAKYPYFPPNFSFSKDVVIVEGEHDIASVYENGWTNSSALGGNVSDDILAVYKRVQGRIYTMYDNDNAGKVYTTRTNTILAEKEVYSIVYSSYSDPDEFFIHSAGRITMPGLMENAEKLKTEEVVVSRKGAKSYTVLLESLFSFIFNWCLAYAYRIPMMRFNLFKYFNSWDKVVFIRNFIVWLTFKECWC